MESPRSGIMYTVLFEPLEPIKQQVALFKTFFYYLKEKLKIVANLLNLVPVILFFQNLSGQIQSHFSQNANFFLVLSHFNIFFVLQM